MQVSNTLHVVTCTNTPAATGTLKQRVKATPEQKLDEGIASAPVENYRHESLVDLTMRLMSREAGKKTLLAYLFKCADTQVAPCPDTVKCTKLHPAELRRLSKFLFVRAKTEGEKKLAHKVQRAAVRAARGRTVIKKAQFVADEQTKLEAIPDEKIKEEEAEQLIRTCLPSTVMIASLCTGNRIEPKSNPTWSGVEMTFDTILSGKTLRPTDVGPEFSLNCSLNYQDLVDAVCDNIVDIEDLGEWFDSATPIQNVQAQIPTSNNEDTTPEPEEEKPKTVFVTAGSKKFCLFVSSLVDLTSALCDRLGTDDFWISTLGGSRPEYLVNHGHYCANFRLRGGSVEGVANLAVPAFNWEKASSKEGLAAVYDSMIDYVSDVVREKSIPRVDAVSRPATQTAFISSLQLKQFNENFSQYSQVKTQGQTMVATSLPNEVNASFGVTHPVTYIEPNPTRTTEPINLSEWGNQVLQNASSKDMDVLTSVLRTNNIRLSAQGVIGYVNWLKTLMTSSGQGLVFSSTPLFLKGLKYLLAMVPRVSKGCYTGNSSWVPDPGMPMLAVAGSFPYSPANVPGLPNIDCTFISIDTFLNWAQYGTGAVPGTFDPATVDSTCVVVPVTLDLFSNPLLLAYWITLFLEYPFRQWYCPGAVQYNSGAVAGGGAATNALSVHSYSRIPGVTNNVILVYVPGLGAGITANVNGTQVPIAGNFAAPVDIGLALYNALANPNQETMAAAVQTAVRVFGSGASWDTACWLASIGHMRWRRPPVRSSNLALSGAVVNTSAPGSQIFTQGQVNWLAATIANQQAMINSATDPFLQIGSQTLPSIRNRSIPSNYTIGFLNSTLSVLFATGGAYNSSKSVWPLELNAAVLNEKFSRVNAGLTMLVDVFCQGMDISAQMVYNIGDQNQGVQNNYRSLLGPSKVATDGSGYETLWDSFQIFGYLTVNIGEMLYRTNGTTNAFFPLAAQTPVSRIAAPSYEGYCNELIPSKPVTTFNKVASNSQVRTADLGGGQFLRWTPQLKKISGYSRWLAQKTSLMTGRWADATVGVYRLVPGERAFAVTFACFPTDYPDDGRSLQLSFAQFGYPVGRSPDYFEVPHAAFQLCMRYSDTVDLGFGMIGTPELWLQEEGRTLVNACVLDTLESNYYSLNWAPIGGEQERYTSRRFRQGGAGTVGDGKADLEAAPPGGATTSG